MPFRQAHGIVGKLVSYANDQSKDLGQLDIGEYQQFSSLFGTDVREISVETSVAARNVIGGTAPEQVRAQLARARSIIKDT